VNEDPIAIRGLEHAFGEGALRRQVLFDVSFDVHPGEIVILTGPSGSGKTTLLTLIGALRSAQKGSVRVLGRELRDADEATLVSVRQRIGYVFQQHNLLDSLTAQQNVQMAVQLEPSLGAREIAARAREALDGVGLSARAHGHPSELSGGERQRVAIARALARRPQLVLADEPTASLDRETGRAVVDILQRLARRDGVSVVLVTHDSRVLDVADRILAMEDGRVSSLLGFVGSDARRMLRLLVDETRRGELSARIRPLDERAFTELVEAMAQESHALLEVADRVQSEVFESVLAQFVAAFEAWLRDHLRAGRARLRFSDESLELPTPGYETGQALVVPVADSRERVVARLELAEPAGGSFAPAQRELLARVVRGIGPVLESWWRMSCRCRAERAGPPRASYRAPGT
jgi:putative ABC transport system ATP-binding protein